MAYAHKSLGTGVIPLALQCRRGLRRPVIARLRIMFRIASYSRKSNMRSRAALVLRAYARIYARWCECDIPPQYGSNLVVAVMTMVMTR